MNPQIHALLVAAHRHLEQGRADQAVPLLRMVVAREPDNSDAANLLGALALGGGRLDEAATWFAKAVRAAAHVPNYHNNLGETLRQLGDVGNAERALREALRIDDAYGPAWQNLGLVLNRTGRPQEAVTALRRAAELLGETADTLSNLGAVLSATGAIAEAEPMLRRAHALAPTDPEVLMNLANALRQAQRLGEAAELYERAIALDPASAPIHYNYGALWYLRSDTERARACYIRAAELEPKLADPHLGLGLLASDQGRWSEAIAHLQAALRRRADHVDAMVAMVFVLGRLGRDDEVQQIAAEALRLRPSDPMLQYGLGVVLQQLGDFARAEDAYRAAHALQPQFRSSRIRLAQVVMNQGRFRDAHDVLAGFTGEDAEAAAGEGLALFGLNYRDDVSAPEIFDHHRAWGRRFGSGLQHFEHDNTPDPARRLRIGFVSPDFRGHSVAAYLMPLVERRERSAFEYFAYAEVSKPDATTELFRSRFDHWRLTVGRSDDEVADMIRADHIDILVDLAGHTGGNRLLVFARKPAPVQVSWLGYPNTTGLDAVDWRFSDAVCEPPGVAEALSTESIWRLPDGFHCYAWPGEAPAVQPPPCFAEGVVTFGSFNNFMKLSDATLRLWSRVLDAVPGSRLMLKYNQPLDPRTLERYRQRFAAHDLCGDRLVLLPFAKPGDNHYLRYHRVDIALDPTPYNGTTTTCEALWMGVPVITLAGDRHCARVGASLLTHLGMPELAADSADDYIGKAAALAADRNRLALLRGTMRARMSVAPLMHADHFADHVGTAFRSMWRLWCGDRSDMPADGSPRLPAVA